MVAFDIPNKPASATALQTAKSTVFSSDLQAMVQAENGTGVISGCGLTQSGSPNMNVVVGAGVVRINGVNYYVGGGNAAVGSNNSGNPRIDLISVNSSGTITVTAGTPHATKPQSPEIPSNQAYLGLVYVADGETGLSTNEIFNRQMLCENPHMGADGHLFINPCLQSWTALNHGSGTYSNPATASDLATVNKRITIDEIGNGTQQIRGWYMTAPSTPYTITAHFKYWFAVGNLQAGLFFQESATNELSLLFYHGNTTPNSILVQNWNSPTSFNAGLVTVNTYIPPNWFRIADDGSNRIYSVSTDGHIWRQILSVGRTSFLTADRVGFCVGPIAAAQIVASLMSWRVS